jgi:hypothetical protein
LEFTCKYHNNPCSLVQTLVIVPAKISVAAFVLLKSIIGHLRATLE